MLPTASLNVDSQLVILPPIMRLGPIHLTVLVSEDNSLTSSLSPSPAPSVRSTIGG